MKFLKSCLITLILFSSISFIGWLLFKNSFERQLTKLNQNVEQNWGKYISNLKERTNEFARQKIENDSVKYYLQSSSKIINSKDNIRDLELNEYKLNKIFITKSIKSNLNDKLNLNLENYNKAAKEYNLYRVRFPNSIIARRKNFRHSFKYFEIRYGIDNEKVMSRKKKTENWVKNGGKYPG